MPVRVGGRDLAGLVERRDLLGSEIPANCAEIVFELLLVASANDDACHRGTLQQPVQGDLRDRLARLTKGNLQCQRRTQRFSGPDRGRPRM